MQAYFLDGTFAFLEGFRSLFLAWSLEELGLLILFQAVFSGCLVTILKINKIFAFFQKKKTPWILKPYGGVCFSFFSGKLFNWFSIKVNFNFDWGVICQRILSKKQKQTTTILNRIKYHSIYTTVNSSELDLMGTIWAIAGAFSPSLVWTTKTYINMKF